MKKNRKFFGCLIAIIALLCLGIGYASLNGELIIGGTIGTTSVDNLGDNRIYFVAAEDATLASENIVKLENNFWEIGEGPSGPDSEIFLPFWKAIPSSSPIHRCHR